MSAAKPYLSYNRKTDDFYKSGVIHTLRTELCCPLAIIALGYALNPDGSMHPILVQRLETTFKLARQLPDALIVVTGCGQQNNRTEVGLMAECLII